jgi:hypothetical protein
MGFSVTVVVNPMVDAPGQTLVSLWHRAAGRPHVLLLSFRVDEATLEDAVESTFAAWASVSGRGEGREAPFIVACVDLPGSAAGRRDLSFAGMGIRAIYVPSLSQRPGEIREFAAGFASMREDGSDLLTEAAVERLHLAVGGDARFDSIHFLKAASLSRGVVDAALGPVVEHACRGAEERSK